MNAGIIAIANQKADVGKTTTSANRGIGLEQEDKKILLVDTPPQGSLTISLGFNQPDTLPVTLATALSLQLMEKSLEPKAGTLYHDKGVDLMSANIELSDFEVSLVNAMSREKVLRQYLYTLKRKYDYIILDCIYSLGMLTINALAARQQCADSRSGAVFTDKGLETALTTMNKVRSQSNPSSKLTAFCSPWWTAAPIISRGSARCCEIHTVQS